MTIKIDGCEIILRHIWMGRITHDLRLLCFNFKQDKRLQHNRKVPELTRWTFSSNKLSVLQCDAFIRKQHCLDIDRHNIHF